MVTRDPKVTGLRRRQVEQAVAMSVPIRNIPQFERGFIREIKEALAMTTGQLAERLGISQQGVSKLELSEQAGTITLNSLNKVAAEFDCKLVYALVPNHSLSKTLEAHALKAASTILGEPEDSQAVTKLAKQMMVKSSPEIWNNS